jgi:signal transduction histidine kinase
MLDAVSDSGMHMRDLLDDDEFRLRQLAHDPLRQSIALKRLISLFEENPEEILQELVNLAVELCHADSAGVSLEEDEPGEPKFRWVAVAGSFAQYINGTTPRFFSPCGTCLSTGRAQLYRVTQPYYRFLGLEAQDIKDGILIPWIAGSRRGTLWAVSHHDFMSFDPSDYDLLRSLADFVAFAVLAQAEQETLRAEERRAAELAKANELAHRINNPLQSLTNTLFLASQGGENAPSYLSQASQDLSALSETVRALLRFPQEGQARR